MRDTTYFLGYRISNSIVIMVLIAGVLILIAGARVLSKAGQSGWKILIPIYGAYCLYKAANSEAQFVGIIATSLISNAITTIIMSSQRNSYYSYSSGNNTIIMIISLIAGLITLLIQWMYSVNMAKAFGKGKGFAAGLFLLAPIFMMILGFGSAEYQGGKGGLDSLAPSRGTWKCSACGSDNPVSRGTCSACGAQKPE